jgi:hypothetical protein
MLPRNCASNSCNNLHHFQLFEKCLLQGGNDGFGRPQLLRATERISAWAFWVEEDYPMIFHEWPGEGRTLEMGDYRRKPFLRDYSKNSVYREFIGVLVMHDQLSA